MITDLRETPVNYYFFFSNSSNNQRTDQKTNLKEYGKN